MYSYYLKSIFHDAEFKCFEITYFSSKKVVKENTLKSLSKASLFLEVQYESDAEC